MNQDRHESRIVKLEGSLMLAVFVRHAQADTRPTASELEGPLTVLGRRQAARVARRLARERFDHIYVSDLLRAQQTARAICRHHPQTPVTVTSNLREIHNWHGRTGKIPRDRRQRAILRAERRRIEQMARRVIRSWRPGGQILIVSHGIAAKLLILLLCGVDPKQGPMNVANNSSLAAVSFGKGGRDPRIRLINCVKHLKWEQITEA